MSTFDAGSIESRLTLDRSSFQRELREAVAEGENFARQSFQATIRLDTSDFELRMLRLKQQVRDLQATLNNVHLGVDVDTGAAMTHLAALETLVNRLDGRTIHINVDVDTGAALTRIAALQAAVASANHSSINIGSGAGGAAGGTANAAGGAAGGAGGLANLAAAAALLGPALIPIVGMTAAVSAGLISVASAGTAAAGIFGGVVLTAFKNAASVSQNYQAAARAVGEAQNRVNSTTPGTQAHTQALKDLAQAQKVYAEMGKMMTPEIRAWTDAQDNAVRSWHDFALQFQPQILRIGAQAVNDLSGSFHAFTPVINGMLGVAQRLGQAFHEWLIGGGLQRVSAFLAQQGVPAFEKFTIVVRNLLSGIGGMIVAFAPMGQKILEWVINMSQRFKDWAQDPTSSGIGGFLKWAKDNGPAVGEFFRQLGQAFVTIHQVFAPMAPLSLAIATGLLQIMNALPIPVLQAIVALFIAWRVATLLNAAAMAIFNAAISTGPMIVIVALIAIVILLITHWQDVKRIATEVWGYVRDFFIQVWNTIQQVALTVWGALQTAWNTVWSAMSSFFSAIWNGIQAAASAVWGFLQGIFQTGLNIIQTVWNAVWFGIQTAFQAVTNFIISTAQAFWAFVQSVYEGGLNAVRTAWETVWNAISGAFKSIMDFIQSTASAFWSWIQSAFEAGLNAVRSAWETIWNAISGAFQSITDFIKSTASAFWDWVKSTFNDALNFVRKLWEDVWNAVSGAFLSITDFIKSTASNFWNTTKQLFTDSLANVRKIWEDAWNAISGAFWSIVNTIKGVATDLWNHLVSGVTTAKDTIARIWNEIRGAFSEPVKFVVNTVYNDGIKRMWDKFVSAIPGVPDLPSVTLPPGFATGGLAGNKLTSRTSDNMIATVAEGEYIVNAKQTAKHYDLIHSINTGQFAGGYDSGGPVRGGGTTDQINNPAPPPPPNTPENNNGKATEGAPKTGDNQNGTDAKFGIKGGDAAADKGTGITIGSFNLADLDPQKLIYGQVKRIAKAFIDQNIRPLIAKVPAQKGIRTIVDKGFDIIIDKALSFLDEKDKARMMANGYIPWAPWQPGDDARVTYGGQQMNLRTMKMIQHAEGILHNAFQIVQGSYSTGVAASAGTHAGGGVVDLLPANNSGVGALRASGFAAWWRTVAQGFSGDHIHAVAVGDPTVSPEAAAQVAAFFAGKNGLANNGPDDYKVPGGAVSGAIASFIGAAIAATGVPASWAPGLALIAQNESGGDPNAINLYDINAQNGVPSQGLMQVIPPTFAAYHQPGTSNSILDPIANIAAAINYIKAVYGDISNVPGVKSVAAGGAYLPYRDGAWEILGDQVAQIHDGEMIIPKGPASRLRNTLGGGGAAGASHVTIDGPVKLVVGEREFTAYLHTESANAFSDIASLSQDVRV